MVEIAKVAGEPLDKSDDESLWGSLRSGGKRRHESCGMDDRRDLHCATANAIDNPVILKQTLSKIFSPILWHNRSKPRMFWNSLDDINNAFGEEACVTRGITSNEFARGL
jgi:hypothetical protein